MKKIKLINLNKLNLDINLEEPQLKINKTQLKHWIDEPNRNHQLIILQNLWNQLTIMSPQSHLMITQSWNVLTIPNLWNFSMILPWENDLKIPHWWNCMKIPNWEDHKLKIWNWNYWWYFIKQKLLACKDGRGQEFNEFFH